MKIKFFHIFLLLICFVFLEVTCTDDPYGILGIERKATLTEVKKAYKQLAKEWHPDKSSRPDAEQKFIEIKQAYELLSDPERRKAYDLHGITNEDFHQQRNYRPDYPGRFGDPFDDFFGHNAHFQENDISMYHKISITQKYFESNVLPKSKSSPHIVIFYSDWCFLCVRAAATFRKIIDSLESFGVVFASVNSAHESKLTRKIGISTLPSFALVVDENVFIYKEPGVLTTAKVVDYIKKKLPYKQILPIDDSKIEEFLRGWHDNKVRAVIFEPRLAPRLRYLITAFNFKSRVHFGFVQTLSPGSKQVLEKYKVNQHLDTLLLFNEDSDRPVASVSMTDISSQTLNNIISANQYLALPRLSSQGMLDGICPAEWNRPKRRLCVILITENSGTHDYARQVLRRISVESTFNPDRVKYAYIYQDKQKEFVSSLATSGDGPAQTLLKIVVIWRRDHRHVKYEWIHDTVLEETSSIADDEENFNKTKQKIDETIQKLLKTQSEMAFSAEVKDLFDEHSQNLATRVIKRLIASIDYMYDSLGAEHIFPAVSVLGTVLFILLVGYLMSYFMKLEEENIRKQGYMHDPGCDNGTKNATSTYVPELRIHELRAEKYNGLVRLIKPGCRTIILIADNQSRAKLLPGFHKAIWPYRKNKTLMFGIMLTERGLPWYSELLRLSMTESRDLQINPRNCIGTVIALNGHRKYFCMYHAKHPESSRGRKRMLAMAKRLSHEQGDPEAGAFLGLESEDSSDAGVDATDDTSKILLEENLLDGLSNWLDRLFEGSTHRYFVNYWPDFPTK